MFDVHTHRMAIIKGWLILMDNRGVLLGERAVLVNG